MKNKLALSVLVCALCFTSSAGTAVTRTISSLAVEAMEGTFPAQVSEMPAVTPAVKKVEIWAEFTPTGTLSKGYCRRFASFINRCVKGSVSVVVDGKELFEIRRTNKGDFILDAGELKVIYSNPKILHIPKELLNLADIKATSDLFISPFFCEMKGWVFIKGGCAPWVSQLKPKERRFIDSLTKRYSTKHSSIMYYCCYFDPESRAIALITPEDDDWSIFVRNRLASALGESIR